MKTVRLLTILLCALAALTSSAQIPDKDFTFVTREGKQTSLYAELRALPPSTRVNLLLFDPDCDTCHALADSLRAATPAPVPLCCKNCKQGSPAKGCCGVRAPESLAQGCCKEGGREAVFAIFPTDELLSPDEPDAAAYASFSTSLPADWIVGVDNGSIFDTDACRWDTLPLLLTFRAGDVPPIK